MNSRKKLAKILKTEKVRIRDWLEFFPKIIEIDKSTPFKLHYIEQSPFTFVFKDNCSALLQTNVSNSKKPRIKWMFIKNQLTWKNIKTFFCPSRTCNYFLICYHLGAFTYKLCSNFFSKRQTFQSNQQSKLERRHKTLNLNTFFLFEYH